MQAYSPEIEQTMKEFYESLSEKERRRYAGLEALKLGKGGRNYIASLFGCSRKTVSKGACEVSNLPKREVDQRIRQKGGGRKAYQVSWAEIDEKFLQVLRDHTAGDPMRAEVRWTNLTWKQIARALREEHQIEVSITVVQKLLDKHKYRRRKAQKRQTMKQVAHRNEQFENIKGLKAKFVAAGNPILSMDTKKKEFIGNFYRAGHLYTLEELKTYDHDFNSAADGRVIPHGIYDLQRNLGYLHLGTSHDTGEFACDCIRSWWVQEGAFAYPNATAILILCDGGGSNNANQYLFKEDLQRLAQQLGLELRIAHFPPYCSKYNPIEHRLFPHVTRACQGVIFTSIELVQQLMAKTTTATGLKVVVAILDKFYPTGRKVADSFRQATPILFDAFLPKWNYRAVPSLPANG